MPVYTLKAGHVRTFLLGLARRPGELVEIGDPGRLSAADKEALATHFEVRPAPGPVSELAQQRPGGGAQMANGLTEEQAREKLYRSGVPVGDEVTGSKLAELFDMVFAAPGTPAEQIAPEPEPEAPEMPELEGLPVREGVPGKSRRKR